MSCSIHVQIMYLEKLDAVYLDFPRLERRISMRLHVPKFSYWSIGNAAIRRFYRLLVVLFAAAMSLRM